MPNTVISIENLSKSYQLGVIGTGTFRGDLQRWWAKLRGLPDPYSKIGEKDHGNREGETVWALKDVNLKVQQGEALGIIGRNGAGKSTLLKILSRVTAPTLGMIKTKGKVASLLEVGTGFHPELTGRENIFMNGAILGMNRREITRKLDEIIEFSGVETYIDTPVKRYSSGMYVRLAFAVAAHLEPDILIVDEVLAVGDAEFQKKCLGKMNDVSRYGRTVLFVSHHMAAIQALCNRTIWFNSGKIIEDGLTSKVVDNYLQESIGASIRMEQLWNDTTEAPGNEKIRIRRFFANPRSGDKSHIPTVDEDVEVGVEFWLPKPNERLSVVFQFFTVDSVMVFSTSSNSNLSLRGLPLARGVHTAKCRVPANLLNSGRYQVSLRIVEDYRVVFRMDDVLVLELLDSMSRHPDVYSGKRRGLITPLLDWSLEFREDV